MSKIVPPFVRSAFNYDVDQVSDLTGLLCEDVSLAQQSAKDECDINIILERFGVMAPQVTVPPTFGDFSGVMDFHTAMNAVVHAKESFMQLPAKIRDRFANDPARLIAFLDDPNNREEATRLGLIPETLANVIGKPVVPGDGAKRNEGAEPPAKPVA